MIEVDIEFSAFNLRENIHDPPRQHFGQLNTQRTNRCVAALYPQL